MNRDEIIKMAREAGFDTSSNEVYVWAGQDRVLSELAKFASLVAAAEREACAKQMDAVARTCHEENSDHEPFEYAAAAIRARGESGAKGEKK